MFKSNTTNFSDLLQNNTSEIEFFGTHTIRHFLFMYKLQFITISAQLKGNKKLTLVEIIALLERQTILFCKIATLKKKIMQSPCKPPLTLCRQYDWFNIGDQVVCFVPDSERLFIEGKVYNNRSVLYEGKRGVSVVYEEYISRNYFLGGYGGLYTVTNPFILKLWEFKYLQNNLEFAHMWIRYCVQEKYSFDSAVHFSKALR